MTNRARFAAFAALAAVFAGGTSFAQSTLHVPSYRPYLGVRILPVTDKIAQDFGMKELRGALVLGIDDQGPAKSADVEPGDLIVKFDGRDIAEPIDIQRIVADATIGKEVPIVIIRMGEEKTKTVKLASIALLRTPTCEELLPVADRVSPGAVEQFFGKREHDMSSSDFDQAIGAVSRCQEVVKAWPRSLRTSTMALGLSVLRGQLESEKGQELAYEQRQRAADEAALRPRLEAERKAAEVRANAEQCRQQCRQRLFAMLEELRSLGADEQSISRLRELDRQHQALMQEMPPDVAVSLKELNDTFVAEYSDRDVAASKLEEQIRQQSEAEKKTAQQSQQLRVLYIYYMEIQVCAERFSQFENARSGLKDVLKSKENGLSWEQVNGIWNATAEKFKKLEAVLKVAGDAQLYTECDQASRYVAGMIMLVPDMGGSSEELPLRKKDF